MLRAIALALLLLSALPVRAEYPLWEAEGTPVGFSEAAVDRKSGVTQYRLAANPDDEPAEEQGCAWIAEYDKPAVEMPCAMAEAAVHVFLDCEIRGWWSRWDAPADVVSPTGDRGAAQINWRHAPGMAVAGLDYESEVDRIRWAIALWTWHSWAPWACARKAGL